MVVAIAPAMDTSRVKATSVPMTAQIMPMMRLLMSMAFTELAKEEKRKGVILTCKEEKIHYYAKFGFVNEGKSVSDHGGAKWYQMRVVF